MWVELETSWNLRRRGTMFWVEAAIRLTVVSVYDNPVGVQWTVRRYDS